MLALAEATNNTTTILVAIGLLGALQTLLGILQLVFKRHGEKDSDIEDLKLTLSSVGESTVELQTGQKELFTKLSAAFKSIDRDRQEAKEFNQRFERDLKSMDHALRGNGHEGMFTRLSKIEKDVQQLNKLSEVVVTLQRQVVDLQHSLNILNDRNNRKDGGD